MENLWKVSGQQLLYFFNLFGVEQRVVRVQGDRLLITHRVTSYCPCSERKPTSCQPNDFSTDFATQRWRLGLLLCHCSLPWAFVCIQTPPPFLSSTEPQSGCSDLQFALEIFQSLVGEGILLMLSHWLEAVVPISRCRLCSTR